MHELRSELLSSSSPRPSSASQGGKLEQLDAWENLCPRQVASLVVVPGVLPPCSAFVPLQCPLQGWLQAESGGGGGFTLSRDGLDPVK